MCRDWYNFLGIQAALPADLKDQLTQAPGTLSQVPSWKAFANFDRDQGLHIVGPFGHKHT